MPIFSKCAKHLPSIFNFETPSEEKAFCILKNQNKIKLEYFNDAFLNIKWAKTEQKTTDTCSLSMIANLTESCDEIVYKIYKRKVYSLNYLISKFMTSSSNLNINYLKKI